LILRQDNKSARDSSLISVFGTAIREKVALYITARINLVDL